MIFKDRAGKDLVVGQKVVYLDNGMLDGEIVEIEQMSVLDGAGARHPRIFMKIALNFPAPPDIRVIMVGNVRIVEDAPVEKSKLSTVGDLTKH
jgi:hypothetical protein